jgi:hypothetical protein
VSSYTSKLTIDELKSTDRSVSRSLVLVGGGLPAMGASWGVESSVPTTWYPGNPQEATQQVLVAKEMPSSWEGEWRLTILNRAPCSFTDDSGANTVEGPGLLHDIFDDFQRKGQRLRVTWSVASDDARIARTIVREGRIRRFNAKYIRSTDIDWECEFVWASRGTTAQKVVASREASFDASAAALIAQANAAILAAVAHLHSSNPSINLSANQFTLGQLEQLANAPLAFVKGITNSLGRIVNNFTKLGDIVLQFARLPFSLANTVVSFAKDTVAQGNQFLDQVSLLPAELTMTSNNVADLTRSVTYFGQVGDAVALANRQAQTTGGQFRDAQTRGPGTGEVSVGTIGQKGDGGILAIHRTKVGDTPASIAMLFYGDPDRDVDILVANRLPWYQVTFDPGTLLVIPVVNAQKGA